MFPDEDTDGIAMAISHAWYTLELPPPSPPCASGCHVRCRSEAPEEGGV
eukprot:CAMPEP_0180245504 /NCGR_PEP_ID=MMETSP0987-20121128/35042_1 /TAXON_ID=697907 /ORGANISM="non described non described, Strain CCMP2293" /LENGTH=48 /DNA_ID= /DNA_START= /DNA_END= /DNA_ORIENTATION=